MGESKQEPPVSNGKEAAQLARFGVFEFRLDTGELRKSGARVRVQRRSFCVLQALLERHGEIVTREELRGRIWPEGTFVDFDSGLNTAVNRLRCALGDSAETPAYVETIARLGYRFVAPVTFLSAWTAARASESVETASTPPLSVDSETGVGPVRERQWWMAAVGVTAAAAMIAFLAGTAFSGHRPFLYKQLTFSVGYVPNARFLRDGRHVVYSSVSHGNVRHAFMTSIDGEDAANPQALNSAEEENEFPEVSLNARITAKGGWFAVEYPAGRPLYRTRARLETARVAPQGGRVAFIEHPVAGDDAGCVMVAGPAEAAHCLSAGWESLKGLAWQPSGDEVWFTAATSGVDRKLRAVNLSGQVRQVAEMPGGMILLDINRAGEVLIARPSSRIRMLSGSLRHRGARDISLLDWSSAVAIAADGRSILFDESGQGGGSKHGVYLYDMDRDKAERIGDGRGVDLSWDGKWALIRKADDADTLWLISMNDRKAIPIKAAGASYNWARFLGGRVRRKIVASVTSPGQGERVIEQEFPNGKPVTLLNDVYLRDAIVDEAGQWMAGIGDDGLVLVDLVAKTARQLALGKEAWPLAFGSGRRLITGQCAGRSIVLESVNLKSGPPEPYSEVQSNEAAGLSALIGMRLAQDGQTYVYSQMESESTLFVVSGWM